VEGHSYLGIYLSKTAATVVCLSLRGGSYNVQDCFSVSVETAEGSTLQQLPGLIAQRCAEKIPMYRDCEIAVALDCTMFMQHNVHSEFVDPKQIAATVRFDAEEALAADVTDVAIAFRVISSDQTGSELAVFTAQRKILSDILSSLQSNNLDPVTIEPDVNCLSRFICQYVPLSEGMCPFFTLLSRRNGYFIGPTLLGSQESVALRTILIGSIQNRTELLAREIPLTIALVKTERSINSLQVFDSAGSVSQQELGEKLNIETSAIDLAKSALTTPEVLGNCADPVEFAIAYGAALAHLEKTLSVNFRNDFMPYQGKKLRLQKALKVLSTSAVVFMLALGLFFQSQVLQKNRYKSQLRDKFQEQYSAVMLGEKLPTSPSPAKKLAAELRRIKDVKSGQLSVTGEESVSAKLTLVLDAFNKCAEQTGLNIDSITVTSKSISVAGDTSSRPNTLKLFESLKESKLEILQQRLDSKGGRDNFRITVEPKK